MKNNTATTAATKNKSPVSTSVARTVNICDALFTQIFLVLSSLTHTDNIYIDSICADSLCCYVLEVWKRKVRQLSAGCVGDRVFYGTIEKNNII